MEVIPDNYLCRDLLELGINTQKKEDFEIFIEKKAKNNNIKVAIKVGKESPMWASLINQTIYEFPTLVVVHKSLV